MRNGLNHLYRRHIYILYMKQIPKKHIPYGASSKKEISQKEQIPKRAHSKKGTFQKEHIPKTAHFKKDTFQKGHIPKIAHSKKDTFQKEHIPKTVHFLFQIWDFTLFLPSFYPATVLGWLTNSVTPIYNAESKICKKYRKNWKWYVSFLKVGSPGRIWQF